MGWSEWKNFGGLTIPYWDNRSVSYGGTMKMKLTGCSTINIGSLKVSNEHPSGYSDNSYFGVFDISDTSLRNPIYKKTAGTSLTNIVIDVSGHDGIIVVLNTGRPSNNDKPMYVTLTNIEIS